MLFVFITPSLEGTGYESVARYDEPSGILASHCVVFGYNGEYTSGKLTLWGDDSVFNVS